MKFLINFFLKKIFLHRLKAIDDVALNPVKYQDEILFRILTHNKNTIYGKKYDFEKIKTIQDFQSQIPIVIYDEVELNIMYMQQGERKVLIAEDTNLFAKSSGTTAVSKLLPVTKDFIQKNHFKGGRDMLALYFKNNPKSDLFYGKILSISGSYKNENNSIIGDISSLITMHLPLWVRWFQAISAQTSTNAIWSEKLKNIVNDVYSKSVTCFSGVPSWMQLTVDHIKSHSPKSIEKAELLIHGGVSIHPFKANLQKTLGDQLHFMEVYNATEGFFAIQDDLRRDDMMLLCDHEVFYEFFLFSDFIKNVMNAKTVSEVEINQKYVLIITSSSGLYRYNTGDVIIVTSTAPVRIKIIGRTKQCINIFGEEVMIHNIENAIKILQSKYNIRIDEYTIAPVIEGLQGYHLWYIENISDDYIAEIETKLDAILQALNSDYEAKRQDDLLLTCLRIKSLPAGTFYKWMSQKNNLGGQYKMPRMSMDRKVQEELLLVFSS
jgi:phenylacetate-coenzyme A ligase PaaK-like adenylate-forming protein